MANLGEIDVSIKVDEAELRKMTDDLTKKMNEMGDKIDNVGKGFKDMGDEGVKAGKKVSSGMVEAEKSTNGLMKTLKEIGPILLAVFAVDKVMALGKGIITLASNLQQAQVSFATMLGSAELAGVILKDLSDFAKSTPFELIGIRENAKQLLAMGVAQENIIPTMKALGDVASGLSVPLERLSLAYGQVLAKGRLQGDELMQFTEAGVPLLETLAAQLGKTSGEISKMVEAGKISAVEVTKAFQTMSGEGGKFANLMEAQSATIAGKWSNLQDSLNSLGESIGANFLPKLSEGVEGLLYAVNQYGDSAGTIMIDTVSVLTDIVSSGINGWNELFGILTENTVNTEKRQITFGKAVLFVFGLIISGFEMVVFGMKTAGGAIGSVVYVIAQRFGALGGVIGSFASQVGGMMKAVGNNIGVALMAGVDVAIGGINSLIALVNKIPGVNMSSIGSIGSSGSLQDFAQWKSPLEGFAEKNAAITKEMEGNFSDFTNSVASDFSNLFAKIEMRNDQILQSSKKTSEEMKKIPSINLDKISGTGGGSSSGKSTATKQAEEQKTAISKLKDEYERLKKKQKELEDADQKYHDGNMKRLLEGKAKLTEIGQKIRENEKAYKESLKKISEEAQNKSTDATDSYVRDQITKQVEAEKMIANLDEQISKEKELAKIKGEQIDTETLEKQQKLEEDIRATKIRQSEQTAKTAQSSREELANRIANLNAELEKLKGGSDYNENTKKLIELQSKRKEQEVGLEDVKSNIANLSATESANLKDILAIERERASLSQSKQQEFDYQQNLAKISKEKAEKEKESLDTNKRQVEALEQQKRIYDFFQTKISFTPEQLQKIETSDGFKKSTSDEQALILKLGTELIQLTAQKDKRIEMEKEISEATIDLSNDTTAVMKNNVASLKAGYQDLIKEIQSAITAQQSLSAGKSTMRGFADGGYTGDGGKYDIAGVVHKGEYVLSQNMLAKLQGAIPSLESMRTGNTYDQSRKVEITGPINMTQQLDFEMLLRKAKFML